METHKILYCFLILFFISSCKNDANQIVKSNDDTIVQILKADSLLKPYNNYPKLRDFYLSKYIAAYEKIKKNPIDKDFFIKLRYDTASTYVYVFILGNYYNEPKIHEAVVLFYLRLGYEFFNRNKYSMRIFSDEGENSYTAVFYIIFLKISGQKPNDGFLPVSVYNWVKDQPEYLKNPDIKAAFEKMKQKLKEKGIE